MPCSHPNTIIHWRFAQRGEKGIKYFTFSSGYSPEKKAALEQDERIKEAIKVPCTRCTYCRIQYSKNWATRLMLELPYHKNNWYVTLTYNDGQIPGEIYATAKADDLGEVYEESIAFQGHLEPEDLTKFWKRLRRSLNYHGEEISGKLKYFCCGEYGPQTDRPHYHAIIYDLPIPTSDLVPYKKNHLGQQLYISPYLEKIWGHGYVTVGQVTWESCAYVARYVMKKTYGDHKEDVYTNGKIPEFLRSSTKLGEQYLKDHGQEIYETDEIILSSNGKIKRSRPPKYFDYLYDLIDPERMKEIIQERKEKARIAEARLLDQTTLTYEQYLEQSEELLKQKTQKLRRTEAYENHKHKTVQRSEDLPTHGKQNQEN